MNTDVVIIGSGPAGCAAGLSCIAAGLSTVIIGGKTKDPGISNNETQPSESIHAGVGSILARLNARHCIDAALQGVYEGIKINGQCSPLGADEAGAWQGFHINRALFDQALLQTAIEQGITVIEDNLASDLISLDGRIAGVITQKGLQINCSYVVDASGHKRFAGKKLKLSEQFYSPSLITWTGVSEGIPHADPMFLEKTARFIPESNGWTWLAPGPEGKCTWTRLSLVKGQPFSAPHELKGYPLAGEIKVTNRRWRVFRPLCSEGILLCGDAGGILDPAAGQGILNALLSAVMAAQTVIECLKHPGLEAFHLAKYDDWFINTYQDKVSRLKHYYGLQDILV